ncbi:hypothetical protein NQ317_011785 [Molorchus minor]|uniref:Protein hunchback n=1 Tax=Molorchus minor TaxID=1323400 RepID=A0ABQ9J7H8_9CUCU|nr:hypothetical protein NQ317_011785 [Molorchus minor]
MGFEDEVNDLPNADIWETSKCEGVREPNCIFVNFVRIPQKRRYDLSRHCLVHEPSHNLMSKSKLFKCKLCDFTTKHKNSVIKHQLVHMDNSERERSNVNSAITKPNRSPTLTHIFWYTKIHQTSQCITVTHANLPRNIKTDSSEVKIFKCDLCDFQSKLKDSLNRHSLLHKDISEVKTYNCDQCSFKSIRKYNLKKHQLIHMDNSDVEMFICEICEFKTIHKYYLKKASCISPG